MEGLYVLDCRDDPITSSRACFGYPFFGPNPQAEVSTLPAHLSLPVHAKEGYSTHLWDHNRFPEPHTL